MLKPFFSRILLQQLCGLKPALPPLCVNQKVLGVPLVAKMAAETAMLRTTSELFSENIGIDIGGSLVKLVYVDAKRPINTRLHDFILSSKQYGSTGERDEKLSFDCDLKTEKKNRSSPLSFSR